MTKKHLDTIIEAQSKRAESSKLFDSQLHPRNMDKRSRCSSIWASTPGTSSGRQGDRLDPPERSLSSSIWASPPGISSGQANRFAPSSSSRLNVEVRSFTPLPHFPVNNGIRTPDPNTSQIELKTLQQAPGDAAAIDNVDAIADEALVANSNLWRKMRRTSAWTISTGQMPNDFHG